MVYMVYIYIYIHRVYIFFWYFYIDKFDHDLTTTETHNDDGERKGNHSL